jgi:hypothetical protein
MEGDEEIKCTTKGFQRLATPCTKRTRLPVEVSQAAEDTLAARDTGDDDMNRMMATSWLPFDVESDDEPASTGY